MTSEKLFFFHNPKSAGTSLMRAIQDAGSLRASPLIENTICSHAALEGRYEAFRGYDLYMGHYGRDVFETVRDGHVYVTNFRHPVHRVISLYNYFRLSVGSKENMSRDDEVDYTCVRAAKELSFAHFVQSADPKIQVYLSDFHFRQLTGSPWVLETPSCSLEEAFAFIDGMHGFYVCEYPELSLRMLRNCLGVADIPQENITERAGAVRLGDLDGGTISAVLSRNRLDMAIYRYAVDALLSRR